MVRRDWGEAEELEDASKQESKQATQKLKHALRSQFWRLIICLVHPIICSSLFCLLSLHLPLSRIDYTVIIELPLIGVSWPNEAFLSCHACQFPKILNCFLFRTAVHFSRRPPPFLHPTAQSLPPLLFFTPKGSFGDIFTGSNFQGSPYFFFPFYSFFFPFTGFIF